MTPLGQAIIEWKDWQEDDYCTITLNGEWIGSETSVSRAKDRLESYLIEKYEELKEFLAESI